MKVSSREKILRAVERNPVDNVGVSEHFWPELLTDFWPGEGYPEGIEPEEFFDLDVVTAWHLIFQAIPLKEEEYEIVEESEQWYVRRDGNGALLKWWKHKSGTPEHIGFEVDTAEKWEEKKKHMLDLNLDRIDVDAFSRKYEFARKRDKFLCYDALSVFEFGRAMLGDVMMLESLLLDKGFIHDVFSTFTDMVIRHLDQAIRLVGKPDAIWVYDDLGYSNGPFLSPDHYDEMVLPYHKTICDHYHNMGLKILLHSCGDVRKLIPGIIRAGFDLLQPLEAKAGMDVRDIADKYGDKLSFMGNIDVTKLITNDREIIAEEVKSKVGYVKNKTGYILHSDHSIPPGVSLETYKLMLNIGKRA